MYKNNVINEDCLKALKKIEDNSINMIYLDPPFYTQKKQKLKSKENVEYEFSDSWSSMGEYINFLTVRTQEMYRVLKEDGTIFLHCDRNASHYLRVMLDKVFGYENFQSEIIWSYKRWSNAKKGLLNNHQTIYMYSKSKEFKFNTKYTDYSATTNLDQILQDRVRDSNNKTKYKLDENGKPVIGKEKKGVPLSDVWEIPYLNPKAKERVGYPTQKPILLLEQIIEIATDENDIVLDPFCGSGTTLVSANILNRKYIGIDASKEAVELSLSRLENPVKTESILLKKGIDTYNTKDKATLDLLNFLGAKVVQRNKAIDGFLSNQFEGYPVPVRVQKSNETIADVIQVMQSSKKSKESKMKVIIKTSNDLLDVVESVPSDFLIIDSYENAISSFMENFYKYKK